MLHSPKISACLQFYNFRLTLNPYPLLSDNTLLESEMLPAELFKLWFLDYAFELIFGLLVGYWFFDRGCRHNVDTFKPKQLRHESAFK